MFLEELLKSKKITKNTLSKNSGIPYLIINAICSGETYLPSCSAEVVYRLAESLSLSVEELLQPYLKQRCSFELFKSNVCHQVKNLGDIAFLEKMLVEDHVSLYYKKQWHPECLYLLAMIDYLSRINNVPLYSKYEYLRKAKLEDPIYPSGILAICSVEKSDRMKQKALKDSIPEFTRHNIIETEIRDVI